MGLHQQAFKLLLNENAYKPITGNFLSIGKHTVQMNNTKIADLLKNYGISFSPSNNLDSVTRHSNKKTITEESLLACYSDAKYSCLDVSDYEGADIIHDMNLPIPNSLKNKYDFIFNGSCMDNIFNPVSFLRNTTEMLKPGGRIIHHEGATAGPGAYLAFTPEYFFSYYSINKYSDVKIYATIINDPGPSRFEFSTDLFSYSPFFTKNPDYNYLEGIKATQGHMHLLVLAEKGNSSTSNVSPTQMQYLNENTIDWRQSYHDYINTERTLLTGSKKKKVKLPYLSDHYKYICSEF